jgi:hypothetical protein
MQDFIGGMIGTDGEECKWDDIDDFANDVDVLCCGDSRQSSQCRDGAPPSSCSAQCAVGFRQFTRQCSGALAQVMGSASPQLASIMTFESTCQSSQDTSFFLNAIMTADCPDGTLDHHLPCDHPDIEGLPCDTTIDPSVCSGKGVVCQQDDPTWRSTYGDPCSMYAEGADFHDYCEADGARLVILACPYNYMQSPLNTPGANETLHSLELACCWWQPTLRLPAALTRCGWYE